LERARLEDLRAQLDAARQEAAQLRERAVVAEFRAGRS
jgi:colicin import membrane protein